MSNKFIVDLPSKLNDAFFLLSLGVLCFFSAFEMLRNLGAESKYDFLSIIIYGFVSCFFATAFLFTIAAFKSFKRYYSKLILQIVFFEDKVEIPCYLNKFWCFSESEKTIIPLSEIKRVFLRGSPKANSCWINIKYMKSNKERKVVISKIIFESTIKFDDFINKLKEVSSNVEAD